MLEHGGRLRQAAQKYNIPLENWIDLSTGINPTPYPIPDISVQSWHRLPEELDGLEEAARHYYNAVNILPLHGSQQAIQILPRLFSPRAVGVLYPSYNEHASAWQKAGHSVRLFESAKLEEVASTHDIVVVINPNNPTGERFNSEILLQVSERLAGRNGALILDEAFMDANPEDSITQHAHRPGLIVLRSLGKFFGLAGARVGFVLAEQKILQAISEEAGPWAISGPPREVAIHALKNADWHATMKTILSRDSTRLANMLRKKGLQSKGTELFQYVATKDATTIFETFARQGILLRLFNEPVALRFGLPGTDVQWERLEKVFQTLENL